MSAFPSSRTEPESPVRIIPPGLLSGARRISARIAPAFARTRVSPNLISVAALAAGLTAGVLFALDHPLPAALVIILCGTLDVLDGLVAVQTGRQSLFGAMLDSSLDRYSEFFIYAGLAYHFRHGWGQWAAWAAFLGAVMVSYTRARAEGLGFSCRVGIMQRAERLTLVCLAGLAGPALGLFDPFALVVLGLIALLSTFTAGQRVWRVRNAERRRPDRVRASSAREPGGLNPSPSEKNEEP
jgi:CDP-diacylglycerol--glycerol-3-phosphate 3-phosphatidyltransferase